MSLTPRNVLSQSPPNDIYFRNIKTYKKLNKYTGKKKEKIKKILDICLFGENENYFYMGDETLKRIGKSGPKFDSNSKVIPYSYVGPQDLFQKIKKMVVRPSKLTSMGSSFSGIGPDSKGSFLNKKSLVPNQKLKDNKGFQSIDSNYMKNYFDKIKTRINDKDKKESENKKLLNNLPNVIKESLTSQEHRLKNKEKNNKIKRIMLKTLSQKCHKTKKMLMDNNDDFNRRVQELIIQDKKEDAYDKYNERTWNMTLRNTKENGLYSRNGYTNLGPSTQPICITFRMTHDQGLFFSPRMDDDLEDKNKALKTLNSNKNSCYLNTLNDLKINGKNLLNVETKREVGFRGKKKLYLPGTIDLNILDREHGPKTVVNNEFREKLFENHIYAKNYKNNKNNNIFEKRKSVSTLSLITSN